MEYTPISARRVLLAFTLTAFVALVPVLFLLLQSGRGGPFSALADTDDGYRGVMLGLGSVLLTAFLIGALMFTVAIGRRVIWRPTRA